jgi:hypothetical protein
MHRDSNPGRYHWLLRALPATPSRALDRSLYHQLIPKFDEIIVEEDTDFVKTLKT